MNRSYFPFCALLAVALVFCVISCSSKDKDKDPIFTNTGTGSGTAETWMLVLIPDTQVLDNSMFTQVMNWIVANRDSHNIKMVLHAGDLTQQNLDSQWSKCWKNFSILNEKVPYIATLGNHDLGNYGKAEDRTTKYNTYFDIDDSSLNKANFGGTYEGGLENSYHFFTAGGKNYIVFALEFGPRDVVLNWANGIIILYPFHRAILITHDFLDEKQRIDTGTAMRSTPTSSASPHLYPLAQAPGDVNCGEEVWEKFVSVNPNFEFVFNGHHVDFDNTGVNIATAHRSDARASGYIVHQTLFNAQWETAGGNGWIRLIEFRPDGTVEHTSYSPVLDQWLTGPEFEFSVMSDP